MDQLHHEAQRQANSHPSLPDGEALSRDEDLVARTKPLAHVNLSRLTMLFVIFAGQVEQQGGIPMNSNRFIGSW
jgi:hypothetical protein